MSKISYLISLSLIFSNSITTVLRSRSRPMKWLLLVFMWILFWGNYENADYSGYEYFYRFAANSSVLEMPFEFLFSLLMRVSSSLGLTYNQFLAIVSLIGLTLIVYTTEKISPKPEFVYVLYLLYPFLLNIVQIRHFLSMSIVFFSTRFLFEGRERSNIKYLLGIAVACSFHIAAAPMIILPVLRYLSKRNLLTIIAGISILASLSAITGSFSRFISGFFPSEKLSYLATETRYGWILLFGIQLMFFSLVIYSNRILSMGIRKKHYSICQIVLKANIVMISLLPFYFVNSNFARLYQFMLLPNYLVYSLTLVKIKNRIIYLILLVLLVTIVGFWSIYLTQRDTVFFAIMERNLLFDFFH